MHNSWGSTCCPGGGVWPDPMHKLRCMGWYMHNSWGSTYRGVRPTPIHKSSWNGGRRPTPMHEVSRNGGLIHRGVRPTPMDRVNPGVSLPRKDACLEAMGIDTSWGLGNLCAQGGSHGGCMHNSWGVGASWGSTNSRVRGRPRGFFASVGCMRRP